MSLRITDVERITLTVPFTPRCEKWNAREVWQWKVVEVCRVETDAGLIGWGETLPHYTWGRVSDDAVARVKGKNPADFLGDDSLGAGLQMALYDVVGKALGVPVYKLLNQPLVRPWCPISWWTIDFPPDALAEEARDALAAGYVAYKTKARPWWDIWAQVEALSAASPEYFKIDLDWNEFLLNASNAAPVLQSLDAYERVALYESPIPHRDLEGNRLLRQKTNRPIAHHFGAVPFSSAAREEICDGFVVAGGLSSILKQGALAAAFEKPFFLQMVGTGLTTALSAHLGAVLPFAQWPAVNCLNNFADDLLVDPLEISGGYVRVPEAPGLGIAFDESTLTKYKMEPPYEIPKERHILSVVWPGGRVVHYNNLRQAAWNDGWAGNIPVQERGVTMETRLDDGSSDFAELFARTELGPVRDRRSLA
jgi:L-alanine-DL-glutamate epimerase-like enolase superfamily enzyme